MLNTEILTTAKTYFDQASVKADEYSGLLTEAQRLIVENFGQTGLYAAYIMVAALTLFVLSKLVKLTFSTLKYLVLPAFVLAFAGSFFVPYSFTALLPVTVSVCSLLLLFKG
ncbi:MAG: hypothetical protein DWP97_06975 [Calditrichaeota bacterium]|nr:MAG: hypothetical protein DWP97_06975 [Calditrichota bacterium]